VIGAVIAAALLALALVAAIVWLVAQSRDDGVSESWRDEHHRNRRHDG
jgi:uncharacterized membrane-anchored protein